ncbi:MAG: hypothetical protein RIS54_533 [Verrucomicrobiota bacterium]|jgi:hypothetical protein
MWFRPNADSRGLFKRRAEGVAIQFPGKKTPLRAGVALKEAISNLRESEPSGSS